MRVSKEKRKARRQARKAANKAYRKASNENRKNEKAQKKAAKDRKLVTRKAESSGDLLKNLDNYDEKKEKGQIKKGLAAMATAAGLATYFGGKDMRRARGRMRGRVNVTG